LQGRLTRSRGHRGIVLAVTRCEHPGQHDDARRGERQTATPWRGCSLGWVEAGWHTRFVKVRGYGDERVDAVTTRAMHMRESEAGDQPVDSTTLDVEAAWIEAARSDPQAFAPLYKRYAEPIYRFCYRKVGDVDAANDLTAQTFIRAIERIDRFKPQRGASFQAWLFTIARNLVTDRWRRIRPGPLPDAMADSLVDHDPGPEQRAVHGDELDRLLGVLDQLPESQRAIIELRMSGLTTNDIAEVLELSVPAVKSAQSRAYKRLRDLLSPPGGLRP